MLSEQALQKTFLDFLEHLELREEDIPDGEVVYYNLGKFSQVISDYEQIHFQTDPVSKYEGFARFLEHQAPGYYPEGWRDAGHARPDAVQVMTAHQAKGMEWPVVFVPCLQKNRFPAKKPGGKGLWHVIPRPAVGNADGFCDEVVVMYAGRDVEIHQQAPGLAHSPMRPRRRPRNLVQDQPFLGQTTPTLQRESEPCPQVITYARSNQGRNTRRSAGARRGFPSAPQRPATLLIGGAGLRGTRTKMQQTKRLRSHSSRRLLTYLVS
ncbi:MAG: 3'-5' exonuclease [Gaiellales bacterium]